MSFFDKFAALFDHGHPSSPSAPAAATAEPLENRRLLALVYGDGSGFGFVEADNVSEQILLLETSDRASWVVQINGGNSPPIPKSQVPNGWKVTAAGGNDDVNFSNSTIPVSINGGSGNDTLLGGVADDLIRGEGGQDLAAGFIGNDTVGGGSGVDTLFGDSGNDEIYGDDQGDSLYGGTGADSIFGGSGNDYLQADDGDDVLSGDGGSDRFFGNAGNDTLFADDGVADTRVNGGGGTDTGFLDSFDPRQSIELP